VRDARRPVPPAIFLAAASCIAAGLVKLVGLPLLIWPLRAAGARLLHDPPDPALTPVRLARAAAFLVEHLHYFVAFWMLLGLLLMVAGAGLLRRRPWARPALEIVCWFGLFEATAVAAFLHAVRRMLLRSGVDGGQTLAAALVPRFGVGLAWFGVYVLLLILLRRSGHGERADGQAEGQSPGTFR
jgi:hypothetical protein